MGAIVLVHGAFVGGWCWQRVVPLLRAAGHDVHAITLTGCGERFHLLSRAVDLATHVADVIGLLEHEALDDVTLVGHSYGGAVVTVVADRARARIGRVVYLDAVAPIHGQTASGAFGADTANVLAQLSATTDDAWLLPPLPPEAVGITRPDDVIWLGNRRHPHPMRTLLEPVMLNPEVVPPPRTYVACTQHEGLIKMFGADPLVSFVERARREGWRSETLDAPHDAMITHPAAVARVLLGCAS